jgi:hypothetical protein
MPSALEPLDHDAFLERRGCGQSVLTDARGHIRLDAHARSCQRSLRKGHRADVNDVAFGAVDQQEGRTAKDLGLQALRGDEHTGDASHRFGPANSDVKRHHRALAEANQQQPIAV